MRIFNQPAYALLNRPYSETSFISELFTRDFGRVGLIAKGARRIKSKYKAALQPFQPVLVSWVGKGEVPTLTNIEINQSEFNVFEHELAGDTLVCGFYCNELITGLIHRHDPHPRLFDEYHATIRRLNRDNSAGRLTETLRAFEQMVMKESGYEVDFLLESDGKTLIEDNKSYEFVANVGFVPTHKKARSVVSGRVVKALHRIQETESDTELSQQSKWLMREILSKTMQNRKIVSRDLFYPRHIEK